METFELSEISNKFFEKMSSRRSIRSFSTKQVDKKVIINDIKQQELHQVGPILSYGLLVL